MTEAQFEAEFVASFTTSTSRPAIHDGFKRHAKELSQLPIDVEKLVDGSFVTAKINPGDVDMVVLARADHLDALPADAKAKFLALVAGKTTQQTHLCDCYFCPTLDPSDPLYPKVRTQRKYWLGEFCFDRVDQPKGIVSLKAQP